MKFVIVPELRKRFTWELREPSGRALVTSHMSFGSAEAAMADVMAFRSAVAFTPLGEGETAAETAGATLALHL